MAAPGARPLFTIGHSNHPMEQFLVLLRRHEVEVVADVRSRPYSRFVPHFSKERLARFLEDAGLGYLYFGRELGGKPVHGDRPGRGVDYRARVRDPSFVAAVERLVAATQAQRIALMCRERDPLDCHRLHLICRYLEPQGLDIRHILPSGEVETQAMTEQRLLERTSAPGLPLFEEADDKAARLERAYDAWWQRAR